MLWSFALWSSRFFLLQFYYLMLGLISIGLHNLFRFNFYGVIPILWLRIDKLTRINHDHFFSQLYHLTLGWLRIWLHIFFICFLWDYHRLITRVTSFVGLPSWPRFFLFFFNRIYFSISFFNILLIENLT
jgi:hypothetical protein